MLKGLFGVFIVVALALGAILIMTRVPQERPLLVAQKELKENQIIETGDLALKVIGTQIVTKALRQGQEIGLGDVKTLIARARRLPGAPAAISVSKDQSILNRVENGAKVTLCPGGIEADVRALYCGSEAAHCIAIVNLPVDLPVQRDDGKSYVLSADNDC